MGVLEPIEEKKTYKQIVLNVPAQMQEHLHSLRSRCKAAQMNLNINALLTMALGDILEEAEKELNKLENNSED